MESFPDERKWPEIPAGEVQIQYEKQFFPEWVVRPWKEFQQRGGDAVGVSGSGQESCGCGPWGHGLG